MAIERPKEHPGCYIATNMITTSVRVAMIVLRIAPIR